jgi:2-iminobutanoate/2-iminopropanoate deaminase
MTLIFAHTIIAAICIAAVASFISPARSAQYLAGPFEKSHTYSSAVITRNGKMVWLAGTAALKDENGKDISSDFEAQVRVIFAKLDKTLKEAGGSLQDMVEMTVYVTDVANGASFANIRKDFFPGGNYPASALVTISHLAFPGMLVEISGTAVIGDECSATATCSK